MSKLNLYKLIALWLVLGCSTQAASFECAEAKTQVERLICEDPKIWQLDDDMANAYANALKVVEGAASIREDQKQWLKVRNSCKNTDCLFGAYEQRVSSLLNDAQRNLRYQLVHTFPYEPLSQVCQPFTDMLNAFDSKEPLMQCEQKIHADYPQFKAIAMQGLPSADNFKYFSAIRDYELRQSIEMGGQPHPDSYTDKRRKEDFEYSGGINGYKYYFVTTDRFIENKTITLLIREKNGDCRKYKFNPQRTAYELDTNTERVVTKLFSFQSLWTYAGDTMHGRGLFYSYWHGGTLTAKPPGKFGSIWLEQAYGDGRTVRACNIAFGHKR